MYTLGDKTVVDRLSLLSMTLTAEIRVRVSVGRGRTIVGPRLLTECDVPQGRSAVGENLEGPSTSSCVPQSSISLLQCTICLHSVSCRYGVQPFWPSEACFCCYEVESELLMYLILMDEVIYVFDGSQRMPFHLCGF
jgi:hypothetical protein